MAWLGAGSIWIWTSCRPDRMLTLLLKHITGHREHPKVQQQQTQPQNSHFTLTGSVFFSTALIRSTVALNSSGATRETRPAGNCTLNRLLKPNLKKKRTNEEFVISMQNHSKAALPKGRHMGNGGYLLINLFHSFRAVRGRINVFSLGRKGTISKKSIVYLRTLAVV